MIYEVMVELNREITTSIKEFLLDKNRKENFSHYQSSETEKFEWDIGVFYQLLTASVRNHDRFLLLNYYKDILVPIYLYNN